MPRGGCASRLLALLVCLIHPALTLAAEAPAVCSHIAQLANEGKLETAAALRPSTDGSTIPDPPDLYGNIVFRDLLDINQDGLPEYVFVTEDSNGSELAIFDANLQRIDFRLAPEAELVTENYTTWQPLRHDGKVYVLARTQGEPGYVATIGPDHVMQPLCELGKGQKPSTRTLYHVLSDYERLLRHAAARNATPWQYAFSGEGFERAELLVRNGHSVNDVQDLHMPLLTWAVWQHRDDVVDWLLNKGANPNLTSKDYNMEPLYEAVWRGSGAQVVLRLLQAGADPGRLTGQIAEFADKDTVGGEPILLAAARRLGYVPQEFIAHAVRFNRELIDVFLDLHLAAGRLGYEWHEGKAGGVPYHVRLALQEAADPPLAAKIERLYRRAGVMQENRSFQASYGSFERGWIIWKAQEGTMPQQEFLLFATSFCTHFLPAGCGPDDLVAKAGAWEQKLRYDCPKSLAGTLDAAACRVAVYFAQTPDVSVFPVVSMTGKGTTEPAIGSAEDLRKLYHEKIESLKARPRGR